MSSAPRASAVARFMDQRGQTPLIHEGSFELFAGAISLG